MSSLCPPLAHAPGRAAASPGHIKWGGSWVGGRPSLSTPTAHSHSPADANPSQRHRHSHSPAMKKPFWASWKGGRNNHEASSSRGPPPRRAPAVPVPVPPRRAPATAADAEARAARNARRRARRARVSLEVAQIYWERRQPLPWGDVHLPEGWHLNRRRVPVPPVPRDGRERTEEILRRRALLPPEIGRASCRERVSRLV